MKQVVRFGILGLGTIAKRFAKVMGDCAEAQLYAVAARDGARAEAFAAEFGAEKSYGGYEALITDDQVDIVYIATTHNTHYELAKRALEAGKAVLCEKPFFLTRTQAEEVVALARSKELLLVEAMWSRMQPCYKRAKQWIADGKIGQARYLDAQFSFSVPYDPTSRLYDPSAAGGAIYDAGVYPLEFATGILGKPLEVNSISLPAPGGVDAFDVMTMRFAGDALATLVCGVNLNTARDAVIYGTKGRVVVRDFVYGRGCDLYDDAGALIESYTEQVADGFIYEIKQMVELYSAGATESPDIPLQDTIDCAALFDELKAQWK